MNNSQGNFFSKSLIGIMGLMALTGDVWATGGVPFEAIQEATDNLAQLQSPGFKADDSLKSTAQQDHDKIDWDVRNGHSSAQNALRYFIPDSRGLLNIKKLVSKDNLYTREKPSDLFNQIDVAQKNRQAASALISDSHSRLKEIGEQLHILKERVKQADRDQNAPALGWAIEDMNALNAEQASLKARLEFHEVQQQAIQEKEAAFERTIAENDVAKAWTDLKESLSNFDVNPGVRLVSGYNDMMPFQVGETHRDIISDHTFKKAVQDSAEKLAAQSLKGQNPFEDSKHDPSHD